MPEHLSAHLPGIGGQLKSVPEDFQVVEVPAYPPAGVGNHRVLEVTKRDLTTPEMIRRLARALGCELGAIGYAGLKDRQAVTTQRLSVPAAARLPETLPEGLLALREVGLHPHKLRRGHLRGNRFRVVVRSPAPQAAQRLPPLIEFLSSHGWPNFYGPQRFGSAQNNPERGRALLAGGRWRDRTERDLLVSAYQAALFNRYLTRRLQASLFDRVVEGDLCARLPGGALFETADPALDQTRLEAFEISPTGPIFGFKSRLAHGPAGAFETAILAEEGLSLRDFRPVRAPGSRRRIRLPLGPIEWSVEGDRACLSFELPAGAYATVLLGEILKTCSADDGDPEPDCDSAARSPSRPPA